MLMVDLDDTLVDGRAAMRSWLNAWLPQSRAGDRGAMKTFLTSEEVHGLHPGPAFEAFARRFALAQPPAELVRQFVDQLPAHYRLAPGVADALARVRAAGHRIAVVSNGPGALQRPKVDRLGLTDLVNAVIISGEVGVAKPDRAIFALAADRMADRLGPHGWMIGDNQRADVVGARDAGLRTVWLRWGRTWRAADGAPGAYADSFADAVQIVLAG